MHRFRSNNKLDLSRQSLSLNLRQLTYGFVTFSLIRNRQISVWIYKRLLTTKNLPQKSALSSCWLLQDFLSIAFYLPLCTRCDFAIKPPNRLLAGSFGMPDGDFVFYGTAYFKQVLISLLDSLPIKKSMWRFPFIKDIRKYADDRLYALVFCILYKNGPEPYITFRSVIAKTCTAIRFALATSSVIFHRTCQQAVSALNMEMSVHVFLSHL